MNEGDVLEVLKVKTPDVRHKCVEDLPPNSFKPVALALVTPTTRRAWQS